MPFDPDSRQGCDKERPKVCHVGLRSATNVGRQNEVGMDIAYDSDLG